MPTKTPDLAPDADANYTDWPPVEATTSIEVTIEYESPVESKTMSIGGFDAPQGVHDAIVTLNENGTVTATLEIKFMDAGNSLVTLSTTV
jgi:hypothetical protein